jgi:hypothetical protein
MISPFGYVVTYISCAVILSLIVLLH